MADMDDDEFQEAQLQQYYDAGKIISSKTLLDTDLPVPEYIIDDVLPVGLTVIAGKPKSGKSWLALQIASHVSAGTRAFGKFECQRGNVLYLALEDYNWNLQYRLRKIGDLGSEELQIAFEPPKMHQGTSFLHKYLQIHSTCRLVIIDTFLRFAPGFDPNKYDETTAVLDSLHVLTKNYGVGIVIVYHTKKGTESDYVDEIMGSTGFGGAVDTIMVLRHARGQAEGFIYTTGRLSPETEMALSLDPAIGWSYLGSGEEYRLSAERKTILEAIQTSDGPISPNDIAAVTEMKYGNVRKLLSAMVNDGQIQKAGRGLYVVQEGV